MNRPVITGMKGNKLNRTIAHCKGNICECLSAAIDAMINANMPHGSGEKGLLQHMREQVAPGAQGPGTRSWAVHEENMIRQQNNLDDHIREHDARGCGGPPAGGSPLPANAREVANMPLPTAQDWGVNNPAAYEGLTGSPIGDAAVGVGVGYLLYRGIRLLPSLLPPAWPTLIPNLAIP
jgi:Toxin with a conserved tryptophan and TIP tripeptide motif